MGWRNFLVKEFRSPAKIASIFLRHCHHVSSIWTSSVAGHEYMFQEYEAHLFSLISRCRPKIGSETRVFQFNDTNAYSTISAYSKVINTSFYLIESTIALFQSGISPNRGVGLG